MKISYGLCITQDQICLQLIEIYKWQCCKPHGGFLSQANRILLLPVQGWHDACIVIGDRNAVSLAVGQSHYVASMLWSPVTDQTAVSYLLKKEMATHSSILAWEIPWTRVSRVGYDLVTKPPPPHLIYGTVSEKEEPQKDKPQL